GSDAVRVEYATGGAGEVAGSVSPLDIGPAPSWRNLRVPFDSMPDDVTAVRLVVTDDDPDPSRWIAFTPPRVAELVTMQELIGDSRPVLPDWAVAFHVPCLRPFEEYAGIHELPEYRILPDRGLAVSSTTPWQRWDGGRPLHHDVAGRGRWRSARLHRAPPGGRDGAHLSRARLGPGLGIARAVLTPGAGSAARDGRARRGRTVGAVERGTARTVSG